MLVVVHVKQLYYRAIHNFRLSICMRMEICQQRESRVEIFLESLPIYAHKYGIFVKNDGYRKAIVFPDMFKEELSSFMFFHSLLAWNENIHLGKYVN